MQQWPMDQLKAMRVFRQVVDADSFAAAARALDMAPAVVTRQIAHLESRLGVRLLNRTTRRLALTAAGAAYLERVRAILHDVDEAEASAVESTQQTRGHLRLLAPPAIVVHQLARHLPRFHAAQPLVTLEIVSPGPVATVDDQYDITLLMGREVPDADFVARRLARAEVILCASPHYLDRNGRPRHPGELGALEVILPPLTHLQRGGLTFFAAASADDVAAQTFTLPSPRRAPLSTTHLDTMYAAAVAGVGVAALPSYVIGNALVRQRLECVLPQWRLSSTTLWAAMPSRQHLPARTRAFLDFLLQVFGGEDRDPWLAASGFEAMRPGFDSGAGDVAST
jgi:DNA-binding transcriptional LysR family regulator